MIKFTDDITDVDRPLKLKYGRKDSPRRGVSITSTVWPSANGGNGHHHVDIIEESNMAYSTKSESWVRPIHLPYDSNDASAFIGRSALNSNFGTRKEVVQWSIGILTNWGVLGNKTYKIYWSLDDDDKDFNPELASVMRKRLLGDIL
jgi:hypothetical protein